MITLIHAPFFLQNRSGKRILIGNTDAEGRMAMMDPLTHARELALDAANPHLYTIATLTGHEVLAHGFFPSVIDNGVARAAGHAQELQKIGDQWGQPVEISRLHVEASGDLEKLMGHGKIVKLGAARVKSAQNSSKPTDFFISGSAFWNENARMDTKSEFLKLIV